MITRGLGACGRGRVAPAGLCIPAWALTCGGAPEAAGLCVASGATAGGGAETGDAGGCGATVVGATGLDGTAGTIVRGGALGAGAAGAEIVGLAIGAAGGFMTGAGGGVAG